MTVLLFKRKGEITVFLSLLLSVVFGFLCIIFESARSQSIKFQKEVAMDAALKSCFGEYHENLYEKYNLLYIDSSYKSGDSEIENVASHMSVYMEENMDFETGSNGADLFQIELIDTEIEKYILASDEDGLPMYLQAIGYMKDYGDCSHTARINNIRSSMKKTDAQSLFSEWDASLERVESFGVFFVNPSAIVRMQASTCVQQLINARSRILSAVPYENIPSVRPLKKGKNAGVSGEVEEVIFTEYLLQNCGSFVHAKDYSVLTCEQEYLCFGKKTDKDNLSAVLERLIRIFASKTYETLGSREGEMKAYAEIIVPPPEVPEDPLAWVEREALVEAVAESLRYAWAQGESILKVDRLLGGGKVNASDPSSEWILPLMEMTMYRAKMGGSGGNGYTYEEFLSVFMREVSRKNMCMRFLDIAEINMRKLGSPGFMVDGCLEYMEVRIDTVSSFGYEYNITRDYAYEERYRKKQT